MKLMRILAVSVIVAAIGPLSGQAKSLREAEIPAEFPPASYKSNQYVDSRGCVYIRAGIDGMTNWVPRVTRSRQVLCGYKPSLAKAAPGARDLPVVKPKPEATPKAKPADKPVLLTNPAPQVTPRRVAKPAPVRTAATTTAAAKAKATAKAAPVQSAQAKPLRRVARPVAAQPRPTRTVVRTATPRPVKPVAPTIETAPAVASAKARRLTRPTRVTSCDGVTGISRYYAGNSADGMPVRCGPQSEPYVTVRREAVTVMRAGEPVRVQRRVVRRVEAPAPAPVAATPARASATRATVGGQVRIAPRHVWEKQQAAKVRGPIPEGYRRAWDDDRLNEERAHQTFDGIHASGLAWTRTVPRKLYIRETGRVVTHDYPGLKYPYHSYDEMRAAGFDTAGPEARAPRKVVRRATPKPAIVATKSARRATPEAPAKGRFVQVGTFGVEANAERTAARLQRMGMPARLARLNRGGKSYRIVLTGPYAPDQLNAALGKARRAGFSDAFVR